MTRARLAADCGPMTNHENDKHKAGPDAEQVKATEQETHTDEDAGAYGAYEAENFGPEGDASKN